MKIIATAIAILTAVLVIDVAHAEDAPKPSEPPIDPNNKTVTLTVADFMKLMAAECANREAASSLSKFNAQLREAAPPSKSAGPAK